MSSKLYRVEDGSGEMQLAEPLRAALPAEIAKAIVEVMGKIKQLGVDDDNKHGGYKFVSVDKFYERIGPLMAAAGLALLVDEVSTDIKANEKSGNPWLFAQYELTFIHASGAMAHPLRRSIAQPISGPQAFGAAQSYIEKQFLRQVFKVPTGEKDADETRTDGEPPAKQSRPVPTGRDQQGGGSPSAVGAGAPAAPAAGKGAEFKPPPGQDMDTNNARELFAKIRDAIGVAGSKGAEVLAQHKDDLAKVAAHSPTAAAELMILPKYNLLRGIVAVAPHEIALDNVWLDAGADGSLEAIKTGSPRIHKLLETQVAKRREMLRASATAPSTEETMP